MLDRMGLSRKNDWFDQSGRIYIIFTIEEIMEYLNCGNNKSCKLLKELEKIGLIESKRQGMGRPNLIYVKNFIFENDTNISEPHFKKCENHTSRSVKITLQEVLKSHANNNNNNINDTDINDTIYPINQSHSNTADGMDGIDRMDKINEIEDTMPVSSKREQYKKIIKDNISFDALVFDRPNDKENICEIVDLMAEIICSAGDTVRINSREIASEVVRSQFLKINEEHIRYVLDSMKSNSKPVKNIRAYLLTALYNAPHTISHHYDNMVNNGYNQLE